jgi:WD40 repeat protein
MAISARWARALVVAALIAAITSAVACAPAPAPSAATAQPSVADPLPSPSVSAAVESAAPTAATTPGPVGRLASAGTVALLSGDGSTISLIDASGDTVLVSEAGIAAYGFPAWSPDGKHLATARADETGRAVVIIDSSAQVGPSARDRVIFRSTTAQPFYLSWRPDSEMVSFLAQETDGLTLRIAPVDASAPLDGSGPHAIIRSGNPFYFDWIGSDRLLAHIGTGPEAFLGELGLDGEGPGGTLGVPGDFRSPVISRDGEFVGVVRARPAGDDGPAGTASIVFAKRDGDVAASMPVIGPAAMAFDPSGARLAAIGAIEAFEGERVIPIGPIRVLEDGARAPRTLLDGSVVGFWWSPDGSTLAAVRVATIDGEPEVRLVFVDVASGDIRAQPTVRPSSLFIEQVLTYFDQYALSHRLWAPDSSSFLLPVIDDDGASRVLAVTPDGKVLARLDGVMAFWSPT